jgi:uncharacterized protein (DUF58 family)
MKIKGKGIAAFIFLGIFFAFFLLFSPVDFIRYIILVIIGFIAVNAFYSLIIPRFITVTRVEETTRGIKLHDIELKLQVKNRSLFPIPYFTVTDTWGRLFSTEGTFLVRLGPFETKTVTYTARGHNRGEYSIGPVNLNGSDPWGFFHWTKKIETYGSVIVYPTIHPMDFIYSKGLPSGSLPIDNKMYEDVTQFRSVREYVPGDDMKRINWKASAKNNKLFTMEYDATMYFPVLTVLNFSQDDYPRRYRETLMERAAEIAASIPFYYATLKQEIGLISTGLPKDEEEGYTIVPIKAGYEHAQGMLEHIATLKPSEGNIDFNDILYKSGVSLPMGVKVMVVTPPLSEEQAQTLIGARRKGLNIQVLQIESIMEKEETNILKASMSVISIKEIGKEIIHG